MSSLIGWVVLVLSGTVTVLSWIWDRMFKEEGQNSSEMCAI